MKQGVNIMETILICMAVFAVGAIFINRVFPSEQTDSTVAKQWTAEYQKELLQVQQEVDSLISLDVTKDEKILMLKKQVKRHEELIDKNKQSRSANLLEIQNFKHRDEAYKKELNELKATFEKERKAYAEVRRGMEIMQKNQKSDKAAILVKLATRDDIIRKKVSYYTRDKNGKKKWTTYERELPGDYFEKKKEREDKLREIKETMKKNDL